MDFYNAIADEEVRPRTREKQVRIIIVEVLRALRSLHEAGVVHKDVKLENVVFRQRGRHSPRCAGGPPSLIAKLLFERIEWSAEVDTVLSR